MEQTIKIHCPICNGFHTYSTNIERSISYSQNKRKTRKLKDVRTAQSRDFTGRKSREVVVHEKKRYSAEPSVPNPFDEIKRTQVRITEESVKPRPTIISRIKAIFHARRKIEPVAMGSAQKVTRLFFCPVKRENFQAILSADDLWKETVVAHGLSNSTKRQNAKR